MTLKVAAGIHRSDDFQLEVDLTLPTDRVTALFGPSGAGKSSILRIIAGLDQVEGARVSFDDQTWQDSETFVPSHQRKTGYVFQHLNLFPHMTVNGNLHFAETRSHQALNLGKKELCDLLDIGSLLNKQPSQLSGGEQQRVAIARALLSGPQLLLMDEPLGSIDAEAKSRILPYLQQLNTQLNIPVIYVSHSLDEVLYLTDHVVTLASGRVKSESSTIDFASSRHAAARSDASAMISCSVQEEEDSFGLTDLDFEGQSLLVSAGHYKKNDRILVRVPARDVSLTLERNKDTSIVNIIECQVDEILEDRQGPSVVVKLKVSSQNLLARITRKSLVQMGIKHGDQVFAQIKGVALMTDHERH